MQLVAVKCFGVERNQSYYGNGVNADEESIWKSARSICQGVVDVAFKSTKATAATKEDDESQERDQQVRQNNIGHKTKFTNVKSKIFLYPSLLIYVLGAQKNRLIETRFGV